MVAPKLWQLSYIQQHGGGGIANPETAGLGIQSSVF